MSGLPIVDKTFIKENSKLSQTIPKKRGGPYTAKQRQERRDEVFKLHFIYSYSASKIAKLIGVTKHTILGDIQAIYAKLGNEHPSGWFYDMFNLHQVRLEAQRSRLMEMLDKETEPDTKLSIERLLLEVDSKLLHIPLNSFMEEVRNERWTTSRLNKFLKKKFPAMNERYVSVLDLWSFPKDKYDRIMQIINENKG